MITDRKLHVFKLWISTSSHSVCSFLNGINTMWLCVMIVRNGHCHSLTYRRYIIIIQPTQTVHSAKIVCSFMLLTFQHKCVYWIPSLNIIIWKMKILETGY